MNDDHAIRVTGSLTRSWEKKNLPRIAAALPDWVHPDHLTLLGLAGAIAIGAGYVFSHRSTAWLLLSIFGLFVHWLGDSLDGTLARVRKQEREKYGYFVDRTADAISIIIICACFGLSPFVRATTGLLLAISYLLLMVHAELCAYVSRTFPMSIGGIGPTEARIALGLFSLGLIFFRPSPVWLDGIALLACGFIAAGFLIMSLIQARRLDRAERIARSLQTRGPAEEGVRPG